MTKHERKTRFLTGEAKEIQQLLTDNELIVEKITKYLRHYQCELEKTKTKRFTR